MIQPTLLFVEMKSKDVTPNLSLEPALIEALMPKDHKSCNLVEFSCGGTWHNSGPKFEFLSGGGGGGGEWVKGPPSVYFLHTTFMC